MVFNNISYVVIIFQYVPYGFSSLDECSDSTEPMYRQDIFVHDLVHIEFTKYDNTGETPPKYASTD